MHVCVCVCVCVYKLNGRSEGLKTTLRKRSTGGRAGLHGMLRDKTEENRVQAGV